MKIYKSLFHLAALFWLVLLTAGPVSGKVASGVFDLSGNSCQQKHDAKTLICQANHEINSKLASGSLDAPSKGVNWPNNYRISNLDELSDNALNPSRLRSAVSDKLKSGEKISDVSVATASVEVNGTKHYFVSVSGKSYSGASPDVIKIEGRSYQVVRTDSGSVKPDTYLNQKGKEVTNANHAEQKLASHIQDNYAGQNAKVNIAVQNTSQRTFGMCQGCQRTTPEFATNNPDFEVNMYQGSTEINP